MLKYPDDFDMSAFPAGKPVAVSRFMGIAMSVVCILIMATCGLIIWSARSQSIHPFLVYINTVTGDWRVVGHSHGHPTLSREMALQESILTKFVNDWFTISDNATANEQLWDKCNRNTTCTEFTPSDTHCALYCMMAEDAFNNFDEIIKPKYLARFTSGERWNVLFANATMEYSYPNGGGMWSVQAKVNSSTLGIMDIIAYVDMGYDTKQYSRTMGYYIKKIDAYNLTK